MIRTATKEDYPALAEIATATFPEFPSTPEEYEFADSHRDPKCVFARWVLEKEGQVVGYAEHDQAARMYHPNRFLVDVFVLPAFQGHGFGKSLYEYVMQALEPHDPLSVRAHTRENIARSVRFLQDRGFVTDMRTWESALDVAAFDLAPYGDFEKRVQEFGIEIKTLRELEGLPDHWEKHHKLSQELNADVPSPEPYTPVEKERWRQRLEDNPNLLRDAYFIARRGGEYVGLTILMSSPGSNDLDTGLTGVRRDFRRQGIALALKLRAIAWAKAQGRPVIRTNNEENNRAMLSINERLGFVKQPAWLDMVKVLKEESK